MAHVIYSELHPDKPVYKLIVQEQGERGLSVHYCNVGDLVCLALLFGPEKKRGKCRWAFAD